MGDEEGEEQFDKTVKGSLNFKMVFKTPQNSNLHRTMLSYFCVPGTSSQNSL